MPFGLHPHVLESHAGVLSEPLFLVLLLGTLATLLRSSVSPHIGWQLACFTGLGRFQDFSLPELLAQLPLRRIFSEGPMEVFQVGD